MADHYVGSRKNDGWTPLHSASQEGHVKLAELLIQHGADVGSRNDDSWTPLHSASQEGRIKIAELLLHHGADVGSRENDGSTPLHSASQEGHVGLAELLIQHGADIDSRDNKLESPLHLAALKGDIDIVKLLLEYGADRNLRNALDKTPFDLASDDKKLEVAQFLSRSTTSLDIERKPTASLPNLQYQHPDLVQPPRRPHEIDVESSYYEQRSVYTASENGQIDVVRSLLDNGADVDDGNSNRETALAAASDHGRLCSGVVD